MTALQDARPHVTTGPIRGSHKHHVEGPAGLRVPVRRIALSTGEHHDVYDTSGPYTDPNATIAWSSSLQPQIKTDISLKTFFGRGSGESFQLAFQGQGWVVLQPYEEIYYAQTS